MSTNRTELNDLNDNPANAGELSEGEMASISGGQDSQRLTIIDTIYSNGTKGADYKEAPPQSAL